MAEILLYLIPPLMIGVVAALAFGLASFAQEGREARERSNRMMRWRIILQFLAVGAIFLFFLLSQG